jgi:hypothetical protein
MEVEEPATSQTVCRPPAIPGSISVPVLDRELASQVNVQFHGVDYSMCVSCHGGDVLVVELEDVESFTSWRGEFTAKCEQQPLKAKQATSARHAWAARRRWRLQLQPQLQQ